MRGIALALVSASAFLVIAVAGATCMGESPAAVLDCYSRAYAERDIADLEELYAEDYVWVAVVPPGAELLDRAKTLEAARNMFSHPEVRSVRLTLGGAFEVVPDEAGGTWRIEGIEASLSTLFGEASSPEVARTCVTLYVRERAEGTGFEIYREVTYGNGDCSGWVSRGRPD